MNVTKAVILAGGRGTRARIKSRFVVVDRGSTDGTVEKLAALKDRFHLRLVQGKFQGYGDAIMRGVGAATGDIVTIVEGDATFRSRDMDKLCEYLKDCDMVIGTRTTLICRNARTCPVPKRIRLLPSLKAINALVLLFPGR